MTKLLSNSNAVGLGESQIVADEQLCIFGVDRLAAIAVALAFVRDRSVDREIYIYEEDLFGFEVVLPKGKLVCLRVEYRDTSEVNRDRGDGS